MATFIQTSGGFLRAFRFTFWSLFSGQIIFALFALIINVHEPVNFGEFHPNDIFSYLVPMVVLGGIIAGYFIYKTQIKKSVNETTFKRKLEAYRSTSITRYAFIEGPNLFCIVAYYLTSNMIFMYMVVVVLIYYLFSYPSLDKMTKEMELSSQEINQLNDTQFQLH